VDYYNTWNNLPRQVNKNDDSLKHNHVTSSPLILEQLTASGQQIRLKENHVTQSFLEDLIKLKSNDETTAKSCYSCSCHFVMVDSRLGKSGLPSEQLHIQHPEYSMFKVLELRFFFLF
jgi:hypothetical protein